MTLSFLVTSLIVVISPGTGVLYTLAVALTQGAKASIAAAFVAAYLAAAFGGRSRLPIAAEEMP